MREIEFRGKVKRPDGVIVYCTDKKDGEWVFGDLEVHRKDSRVLIHLYNADGGYYRHYDVDPDTVGQFTGFLDKNGKEIYDGDILDVTVFDCFDNDRQYRVRVEWVGTEFMGVDVTNDDDAWNLCWLCNQDEEIEVVGNIYDNPELINK